MRIQLLILEKKKLMKKYWPDHQNEQHFFKYFLILPAAFEKIAAEIRLLNSGGTIGKYIREVGPHSIHTFQIGHQHNCMNNDMFYLVQTPQRDVDLKGDDVFPISEWLAIEIGIRE